MIMLDTSSVIEVLRKTQKGDKILREISGKDICLPVFAVHELFLGNGRGEKDIVEKFPVLAFEKEHGIRSSQIYSLLSHSGELIELVDIFIASIALENNIEFITCDRDFEKIRGLKVKVF